MPAPSSRVEDVRGHFARFDSGASSKSAVPEWFELRCVVQELGANRIGVPTCSTRVQGLGGFCLGSFFCYTCEIPTLLLASVRPNILREHVQ